MSTAELHTALQNIFERPIESVRRVPSPYSSSFMIEEIELTFAADETLTIIFKNLSSAAMLDDARQAKPGFLYQPEREIEMYRSVLSPLSIGTAELYGAVVEPTLGRYWLFIERVHAPQLYEFGEFGTWCGAAQWAATLHSVCNSALAKQTAPHLLNYDASYFRHWVERARAAAGPELDPIVQCYDRVIEVLIAIPTAVVHGEFYSSNILVEAQGNPARVCPVDWEMAGVGPCLLDVAALASGKWNRAERLNLLEAYSSALPHRLRPRDQILAFDCCQLHIALQWLGWSQSWSPPPPRAHDWLGEALHIFTLLESRL